MTLSEKGRFCLSCQKEVIDFTRLDDSRVLRIIQENSGSLCGRFRKNQLGREMYMTEHRWDFPFRKDLVLALLALGAVQPLVAQSTLTRNPMRTEVSPPAKDTAATVSAAPESGLDSLWISGRVIGLEDNMPVAFAVVRLLEFPHTGVMADQDGYFGWMAQAPAGKAFTLTVSAIGYATYTRVYDKADFMAGEPVVVQLSDAVELGGAVVITKKRCRVRKTRTK